MPMTTIVACDDCSRKVELEEAYHRRTKGFLCAKCYESGQWVFVIPAVLFAALMVIAAVLSSGR